MTTLRTPPRVADFPDPVPLLGDAGVPTGVFSDWGAWFGVLLDGSALAVVDLVDGTQHPIGLAPIAEHDAWADRLELTLADGGHVRVAFLDARTVILEARGTPAPDLAATPYGAPALPHRLDARGEAWTLALAPRGGDPELRDPFGASRARWNQRFEQAFRRLPAGASDGERSLFARALVTLGWNTRAALPGQPHARVVEAPLASDGGLAADAWSLVGPLAGIAPALAEQHLRTLLAAQTDDGMLPAATGASGAGDASCAAGPPRALRALAQLSRALGDRTVLEELGPAAARALSWWHRARRVEGEPLLRTGGANRDAALRESGWGPSLRFAELDTEPGPTGDVVLDLWPVDLNAAALAERRVLRELAADSPTLAAVEAELEAALPFEEMRLALDGLLWDDALGLHVDRRPSARTAPRTATIAGVVPAALGVCGPGRLPRLRALLCQRHRFATPFPLPSIAADTPGFDPEEPWNGAVHPSHAVTALGALGPAARGLRQRLLDGLLAAGALARAYSPRSGAPAERDEPAALQSSQTAAAALEILLAPTPATAS